MKLWDLVCNLNLLSRRVIKFSVQESKKFLSVEVFLCFLNTTLVPLGLKGKEGNKFNLQQVKLQTFTGKDFFFYINSNFLRSDKD